MLRHLEQLSSTRLIPIKSRQRILSTHQSFPYRFSHRFISPHRRSFLRSSIMSSNSKRIYDLIDGLIRDIDNAPTFRSFSTSQAQSTPSTAPSTNAQQGRKKKKKKIKVKKEKGLNNQQNKPSAKASKRTTLLEEMHSTYDPFQVEHLWDQWWEEKGYYKAKTNKEKDDIKQDNFVMVIPPPNVTGSLHLGHALMATIEDTITRYWRMKGKNCLWLPGTDHAGIATQSVVERKLARDNLTRHDLGRKKFLDEVWKWKNQKGGNICNQIRKLGCSVDWSREVFTMDDKLSKAVTEAFVRLYDKGLIYRDNRLCHWSCSLQSAISDVEIDKIEIGKATFLEVPGYPKRVKFGIIHKFGYRVIGSDNEIVTVATTRLETMLGDTAVAVHPEDKRYTHLHGKYVHHPFIPNRKIPIITDAVLVDMTFGTGVVKITPAHDHNDFECGKRHNLEFINILNGDGTINENGGKFAGKKRYDVRKEIATELEAMGLFFGEEVNPMVLDQCSRSKDIIEPLIKPQWYMDCDDLAQRALDAVFKEKTLKILPQKEGEQQWTYFLGHIRRWCISRQLWWGHRIPAFEIKFTSNAPSDWNMKDWKSNWIVARSLDEAKEIAAKRVPANCSYDLVQDEDVLDTWFSSGLFPFSTMGWPDNTDDLESFYPGDLLETGGDIIFFWVARMVMMSLGLMDKLPFHTVYLHPMVRDEYGKKMSKSSGNVVDPLHIIHGVKLETLLQELHGGNIREDKIAKFEKEKKRKFPNGIVRCGADALRFGLSSLLVQRSINLNVQTVIGYRMFCNKIWNATKLAVAEDTGFGNQDDAKRREIEFDDEYLSAFTTKYADIISVADRWILSRLNHCMVECEGFNQCYKFGESALAMHHFFYHEFCPIYLELIKPTMRNEDGRGDDGKKVVREVLFIALSQSFKMMHPFMPFLTEELFQRIRSVWYGDKYKIGQRALIVEPYPDRNIESWKNPEIEQAMQLATDLSTAIRSTKQSTLGMSTKTEYAVYLKSEKGIKATEKRIEMMASDICRSALCESVGLWDESKQNENDFFVSSHPIFEEVMVEEKEQQYTTKQLADTIFIYSDVRGKVATEQRLKKFEKEIGKLSKLVAKSEKTMAKCKKDDILKKEQKKMDEYKEKIANIENDMEQLKRLNQNFECITEFE